MAKWKWGKKDKNDWHRFTHETCQSKQIRSTPNDVDLARILSPRQRAKSLSNGLEIVPKERRKMTWTVVVRLADEGR
jgi:hypothetical protein